MVNSIGNHFSETRTMSVVSYYMIFMLRVELITLYTHNNIYKYYSYETTYIRAIYKYNLNIHKN